MKDLSVEYAHIYSNDKIGKEHELSLGILGKLRSRESANGRTISLVVMVDDYSFPDNNFDYGEFSRWLSENGFTPNLILRESALIPLCGETLTLIEDSRLKKEIEDYVRMKRYPCSLFVAAWYLLRLGYLNSPIFPGALAAERLINILPSSFETFENKALEIISKTRHKDAIERIEYKYFEGRKIP